MVFDESRLLTPKEVAEYLALNEQTVRKWLREGKLPGVKLPGDVWRVKPETLKAFLENSK